MLDVLDADFTFVNERLARHYGLTGVKGEAFGGSRSAASRGGLLTQASVLTVTSNPNRTSPVKRGRWVLEQILGTPPPPPPAGVSPQAEDHRDGFLAHASPADGAPPVPTRLCGLPQPPRSARVRAGEFRRRRRLAEQGQGPRRCRRRAPAGESFRGPGELKAMLKGRPREFARCLAEKLMTYAIGRGMEDSDRCAVDRS